MVSPTASRDTSSNMDLFSSRNYFFAEGAGSIVPRFQQALER
jgi:hypothetical protein